MSRSQGVWNRPHLDGRKGRSRGEWPIMLTLQELMGRERGLKLIALLKRIREKSPAAALYLVGGGIRDALLGRSSADWDLAVFGIEAGEAAREWGGILPGSVVPLEETWGIFRVVEKGDPSCYWDFSQGSLTILSDLLRRDFTINSMGSKVPLSPDSPLTLIDPLGGERDARLHLIRAASSDLFLQDPLRILRGVRLACNLGFSIGEVTLQWMQRHRLTLSTVSPERIRDEVTRILESPLSYPWVDLMDRTGILEVIVPEILPMKGHPQNRYHAYDVWTHSLKTLEHLEEILSESKGGDWAKLNLELAGEVAGGRKRLVILKVAALLHDIGKPSSAVKVPGGYTFHDHEDRGASMLDRIMKRLRFSRKETHVAKLLLKLHLRFLQLVEASFPTGRALLRLFREAGGWVLELLLLSLADFRAKGKKRGAEEGRLLRILEERGSYLAQIHSSPLLTGKEVMEILRIPQGKEIGRVLKLVEEERMAGKISTRGEAVRFLKEMETPQKSRRSV